MKQARSVSLLAAGTLLGALVITQGLLAQDAQVPPEAAQQDAPTPEQQFAETATEEEAPAPTDQESESTVTSEEAEAAPPKEKLPALDLRRITLLQGDAVAGKAKTEVCAACHGIEGIAAAPIFPNLAGQHPEYLYWQLMEYKRDNVPATTMTPLVTELTEIDMRDIAMYYASLPRNPAPAPAAPVTEAPTDAPADAPEETPAEETAAPSPDPALLANGEALYLGGDPAKGIPPCQGCHGADALGFPDARKPNRNGHVPYALFPILRGQQLDYLQTRLTQYQGGETVDSNTDKVMNTVGHRLDSDTIAALSTYLSNLRDN